MEAIERAKILDEFGDLYNESKIWAPKEKRMDALKDTIRSWYPDLAANKTEEANGQRWKVFVGEKTVEKSWTSMSAVCKAAGGLRAFLKICNVTFKALSEAIGKSKAEALQVEAQTGNRKVTAVAIVAPAVELPKAA